jgi:hypothetical protein
MHFVFIVGSLSRALVRVVNRCWRALRDGVKFAVFGLSIPNTDTENPNLLFQKDSNVKTRLRAQKINFAAI